MIKFPEGSPVHLDLACGDNKRPGFLGVDKWKTDSTDYVFDLLGDEAWPIEDSSVDMLHSSHFVEHIPGLARPKFFEECWRILKPGAQFQVIVPYWNSHRAVQDFTHAWPPVCEASFLYFNKTWRQNNKLEHGLYDVKADFDFTYGYSLDPEIHVRNQEYQQLAVKYYTNSVMDLFVTLTARK